MCPSVRASRIPAMAGLLLLLTVSAGSELTATPSESLRAIVAAELKTSQLRFVELDLPSTQRPENLSLRVTTDRGEERLTVRAVVDRSATFRLFEVDASGERIEIAAPLPKTYRGQISSDPGSVAAVSLVEAGCLATVYRSDGSGWSLRPLRHFDGSAPRSAHVLFPPDSASPGQELACGTPDREGEAPSWSSEPLDSDSAPSSGGGAGVVCELHVADLAYDSDYEFFEDDCEGDTDTCVEIIEQGLNITNAIYIRDLKTIHRTSTIVLRTDPATDFYAQWPDASDFGDMLRSFRAEWNANMTDVEYDMAYLLTGKSRPEYGGLAYVSVVCSSSRYGMGIGGRGYDGIFRHELGHNWGASHSCGTERRFIMCGNSISAISGYNIRVMGSHRDSRDCLETEPYEPSEATPPLARLDRAIVGVGQGPVSIDVVSGDTDLGCGPLRLADFDSTSGFGASIFTVDPVDPADPLQLLYVPRSRFLGTDYFRYTVVDEDGQESRGVVLVETSPRALLVHHELEETSGDETEDSSGFDHDGELRGDVELDALTTEGRFGRALAFQGVDGQYVSLGNPSMLSLRREVTVAAWFRFDDLRVAGGERLVSKGGDAYRIERAGSTSRLRFVCTGVQAENASDGSVVASTAIDDGEWHHVTGVYDGSRLSIYIDGEVEATRRASGPIGVNSSSLRIADEQFAGAIDEVRVYSWGMSDAEVSALYRGARIENTDPPDAASGIVPGSPLSWLPTPGASGYHVYVGSDRDAVLAANSDSDQYRGFVDEPLFRPSLDTGSTYWWRIDPVQSGSPVEGDLRSFRTTFAFTNFDEPAIGAGSYSPRADARELGFRMTAAPTEGEDPLAAVVSTSSTPSSPVFGHRSVNATTTFDAVDLSERGTTVVSLILQARSTGYEEGDRVTASVSGPGTTRDLVRFEDPITLSQRAGTGYATYATLIPADWDEAVLEVRSRSNSGSGSERFDFDRIGFSCFRSFDVIAHSYFSEADVGATIFSPGPGDTELGFVVRQSATGGASPFLGIVETSSLLRARSLTQRSVATTITFDQVDLTGAKNVWVTAVFRVRDTGYESADHLRIYVTDGNERVYLIDADGNRGLESFADDRYTSLRARVPDAWEDARLVVVGSSDSSAGAEGYDLRLVEFTSESIGDPCSEDEPPAPGPLFRRGDSNGDGNFDLSDGIGILNFLFVGGPEPSCEDASDTDNTGTLDLSDGVSVFNYLFLGGNAPPEPGIDSCGIDPDEDLLGCESYPPCSDL